VLPWHRSSNSKLHSTSRLHQNQKKWRDRRLNKTKFLMSGIGTQVCLLQAVMVPFLFLQWPTLYVSCMAVPCDRLTCYQAKKVSYNHRQASIWVLIKSITYFVFSYRRLLDLRHGSLLANRGRRRQEGFCFSVLSHCHDQPNSQHRWGLAQGIWLLCPGEPDLTCHNNIRTCHTNETCETRQTI